MYPILLLKVLFRKNPNPRHAMDARIYSVSNFAEKKWMVSLASFLYPSIVGLLNIYHPTKFGLIRLDGGCPLT